MLFRRLVSYCLLENGKHEARANCTMSLSLSSITLSKISRYNEHYDFELVIQSLVFLGKAVSKMVTIIHHTSKMTIVQ